ncbi:MAG: hypothetical protein VKI93_02855 [Synechococcus sp.]|nr:hypothetical protein [Synechococcus sp.]
MASLQDHFSSADSADYLAGIGLSNATIKFKASNPRQFTIKASTGKSDQHDWAHVGGESGSVSSKHLVKNFEQYFQDASSPGSDGSDSAASSRDASEHSVIASLPSGLGNGSFLFESNAIKHKKGGLVWKGTMLDHDYVSENHVAFAKAFGDSTVHNHLRYDPTQHIVVESDSGASARSSRRMPISELAASESDRGPLAWGWNPIKAVSHAVSSVTHSVSQAASTVAHAGQAAANTVAHAATSSASAVKNGVSQAVKATDSHVVAPVVHAANVVANAVAGKQSDSFSMTWPELEISGNNGPFSASLSATPTMSGELVFTHGYVGAVDPTTIQLTFTPSLPITGNVSADLGSASDGASFTIDGPSVSTEAPIIMEATLSSALDFDFSVDATLGDNFGDLSATVTFTPAANFTLAKSGSSFKNVTKNPVVTTNFGTFDFDDLSPDASMSFTATPSITLTAGPEIPESVPYVGGKGLATLNTTFGNPVELTMDFADPSKLNVAVSGTLGSSFEFFGADVNPPLVDATLYGPIHTVVNI